MISYGRNTFEIEKFTYFIPHLQSIIRVTPEYDNLIKADMESLFEENGALYFLTDAFEFKYRVQSVCEPKYSKAAELLITDRCNLCCAYCYSGEYRSEQTMNIEFAGKIVKNLFLNAYMSKISKGKEDTVYIFFHGGGEPTQAWDELAHIVEYANELSCRYGIKIRYNLATNGVFDKNKLSFLIDNGFQFRISLDGIGRINDQTRCMENGKSCFDIIAENLDMLNKTGNRFVIAGVVTNENIDEMGSFVTYSVERWPNVYDMRFFMLEETGLTVKNNIELLNMIKFQDSLYNCVKLFIDKKIRSYKKYTSFHDYLLRNHKGCCSPSVMHMPVYNSNGDILRCNAHVNNEKAKIGYFSEGKIVFEPTRYDHLFDEITGKTSVCKHCLCSIYCEFGGDSCVEPIQQTEQYCSYMQQYFEDALITVFNTPSLLNDYMLRDDLPGIEKALHWKT